jgi:hypothetical protein
MAELPPPSPASSGENPDRVGIYLDVLENIIRDLNDNSELQQIFGVPVSHGLVIVADSNDLRIEDGARAELTEDQSSRFLAILGEVIEANAR